MLPLCLILQTMLFNEPYLDDIRSPKIISALCSHCQPHSPNQVFVCLDLQLKNHTVIDWVCCSLLAVLMTLAWSSDTSSQNKVENIITDHLSSTIRNPASLMRIYYCKDLTLCKHKDLLPLGQNMNGFQMTRGQKGEKGQEHLPKLEIILDKHPLSV